MFKQVKRNHRLSPARERQAVVCVSTGQCFRGKVAKAWCWSLWLLWIVTCTAGCGENGSAVVIQGDTAGIESERLDPEQLLHGETDTKSHSQAQMEIDTEDGDMSMSVIYVHICGQVCSPGVYGLPEGSRVWDAVEAAGGLTEEADPDAVNLALVVADGSKVTIPSRNQESDTGFRWYETGIGELGSVGGHVGDGNEDNVMVGGADTGRRVDLNRADVNALMKIPGIGQVRAEAIIAYRETRGPFDTIEEVMQVAGIKEGLFERIREYITVGG